ncbi:translation initiation factor eIF3 subunit g [Rhodotorula mucilaginosa]|uniref:Eukaryotic translation initiation factor 3 subunit G n=1 Tax=Rhodotorula mucilaginosa TaxID=5537 RepID=A0A9P6VSZ2_RHOMI|nr:translation initiation factor eIF3 subunit g [Rhodotorula mucilaginosa]TKA50320.1 hypothetical protein B0A53_06392 [Rhodotorula sp. CCFEE 5036]
MAPNQSWADETAEAEFPPRTETTDANGVTTIVEYRLNDDGKRVKVTRRIKRTLVKKHVNHVVAERMHWKKWAGRGFGLEKNSPPGPTSTTTVGETEENQEDEMEAMRKQLKDKKVTCRYCQGDHFTARCPYKDTLGAALGETEEGAEAAAGEGGLSAAGAAGGAGAGGSRYVPPSMRAGAKAGPGQTMNGPGGRDEFPTLRVTNLSEDATDQDMWELFGRFANRGRINRIYVGKDQETGLCKGFGFVSFEDRSDAEAAMKKVHGLPYDHLILQVQWSVPKEQRTDGPARG